MYMLCLSARLSVCLTACPTYQSVHQSVCLYNCTSALFMPNTFVYVRGLALRVLWALHCSKYSGNFGRAIYAIHT
jgi:hypothetical protein